MLETIPTTPPVLLSFDPLQDSGLKLQLITNTDNISIPSFTQWITNVNEFKLIVPRKKNDSLLEKAGYLSHGNRGILSCFYSTLH